MKTEAEIKEHAAKIYTEGDVLFDEFKEVCDMLFKRAIKDFTDGAMWAQKENFQIDFFKIDVQKLRATVTDAEFRRLLSSYISDQLKNK